MLNFSLASIIPSLIFSGVGLYLFSYGKKKVYYPYIFSGVALMVYPYFVDSVPANWGIGILICGVAYYYRY